MNDNIVLWQRCFTIPRDRLDLFICRVRSCRSNLSYFRVDYIFQKHDHNYDVVVSEFGQDPYPYAQKVIIDFVEDLEKGRI